VTNGSFEQIDHAKHVHAHTKRRIGFHFRAHQVREVNRMRDVRVQLKNSFDGIRIRHIKRYEFSAGQTFGDGMVDVQLAGNDRNAASQKITDDAPTDESGSASDKKLHHALNLGVI